MGGIRFFMALCVFFLIATYQSCSEMRLSLAGRRTEAKIDQVLAEVDQRTKEETGRYLFRFSFRPEGEDQRPVQSDVSISRAEAEAANPGDKLQVIYLPSRPDLNRVVGHRQLFWVAIFFVFLAVIIGWGMYIWRQAMSDLQRSRRR